MPVISELVEFLQPKTILDYGCGKGGLVKALAEKYPQIKVYGYDPAVPEFENMPVDEVDLVVNTDVLEHIPEDELAETVERISKLSKNVFFQLHHEKAVAVLPNGENAHCTVREPEKYYELFRKYFTTLTDLPGLNHFQTICLTFNLSEEVKKRCKVLLQGDLKFIDSLEDFVELLNNNDEVIFMHGAQGGKSVLDWLEYSNNLNRICCVATPVTKFSSYERYNDFENNLPVLPLYRLPHFCETGIFVVAMNPRFQGEIYRTLTQFGCKNSFFLGTDAYAQIAEELKNFMTSEQVIQRFINRVDKKLEDIENLIEVREEIVRTNTEAFGKYKGAFKGKKVVIFAGGPTAKYYKPMQDAIHIGVNFAWQKGDVPLDCLFVNAKSLNDRTGLKIQEGFDDVRDRVFVRKSLPHPQTTHCCDFGEDFTELEKVYRFFPDVELNKKNIYPDICSTSLYRARTIVFFALQFALFTHPKEIYLVGCDTSRDGHFFKSPNTQYDQFNSYMEISNLKVSYSRLLMFARHYYPDTEIISVNPVNLKGLFTDIYTDEYKKSLE